MAGMTFLGAINDPGVPGKTGDDRYGFDEQAGTAWALDGATDVTDLKPFPGAESGAAWVAQAFSDALMAAPDADWPAIFAAVHARAETETKLPLDTLPGEASPVASGVWAKLAGGAATVCWLGDCLALVDRGAGVVETVGSPDKAEAETEEARRLNAMSPEDRRAELQAQRRAANANGGRLFGLGPGAAARVNSKTVPAPAGTELLLMTDGFYRLISPYGLHDAASLFALVRDGGLNGAVRALRSAEGPGASGLEGVRIKRSDDACCVWVRVGR